MGKRQLGQLQPFEFVITLIIADLATLPMSDRNIPLLNGIVPLITLLITQFLFSVLTRRSNFARRLLNGKPIVVISPQGINYNMLKELNMNLNDIQEAIRCAGTFKFEDISYAIVETNGSVTVLPKSQSEFATKKDLKIDAEPNGLPRIIVCDGKIINENLITMKIDNTMLEKIISKSNCKTVKDFVIVTFDDNKNVFIQTKKGKVFNFQMEE